MKFENCKFENSTFIEKAQITASGTIIDLDSSKVQEFKGSNPVDVSEVVAEDVVESSTVQESNGSSTDPFELLNKAKAIEPLNEPKAVEPFTPIRTTFAKKTIVDAHLGLVFAELAKNGWVANDALPDDFSKIFGGRPSGVTVTWTENPGVLKELVRIMIERGYITCPEAVGYLQILQSHFVDAAGEYLTGLKGAKCKKKALPIIKQCINLLDIEL